MTITVRSPAFADGDTIPGVYTCDGDDVSPPLEWSGVPSDVAELAVVVEDPDAPGGTFVHWVLWGLDAGLSGLGAPVAIRSDHAAWCVDARRAPTTPACASSIVPVHTPAMTRAVVAARCRSGSQSPRWYSPHAPMSARAAQPPPGTRTTSAASGS